MSNATLRLITQPSDTLHLMDIPYDTTYVAIRPRFEDPVEDPVEDSADNSIDNLETNPTPTLTHYEIQVGPPTDFTKIWVMAAYSSLEIATYAFELMLQTAFTKEELFFQFPTEEDVLELMNSEREQEQRQKQRQEQKLEQKQDNMYLN